MEPRQIGALYPVHSLQVIMSTKRYDGQPHTFDGVRGAAKPHDLSIRDLRDCLLRSLVLYSPLFPWAKKTRGVWVGYHYGKQLIYPR